jgi:hypothetical protein
MTSRTPKSGVLRRWILLPESKKMIIVAVVSVLGFAAVRSLFAAVPERSYTVQHVLTEGACGHALGTVSAPRSWRLCARGRVCDGCRPATTLDGVSWWAAVHDSSIACLSVCRWALRSALQRRRTRFGSR